MKVILLEDVKKVGKKGDIVELNDSYARNVIISKKLGVEATNKSLNDLKLQNKNADKIALENLEAAKELAKELEKLKVEVSIKTGSGGRSFGSVSTKEISSALKAQHGIDIDKKKMQLPEALKNLGTYEVPVKLHPQVTGTLRVHISEGQ
ncbi:MAG: 50S ribosomal protein L9 [Lachnospiraceae bacterium]|nr:50S ribosomal protein L9 [Lachnospiraceae bacterium]